MRHGTVVDVGPHNAVLSRFQSVRSVDFCAGLGSLLFFLHFFYFIFFPHNCAAMSNLELKKSGSSRLCSSRVSRSTFK